MKEYWYHVDHPDDERYDTITIETIPRWKESELSGDEYRFSYLIKGIRKGEVIVKKSFSRMEWALQSLPYVLFISSQDKFDAEALARTRELCDQPTCAEKPTVFYKRLKPYDKFGGELVDHPGRLEYRQFCDKHKHRGDCGLDDSDNNYEVIPDPRPKKD